MADISDLRDKLITQMGEAQFISVDGMSVTSRTVQQLISAIQFLDQLQRKQTFRIDYFIGGPANHGKSS